MDQAVKWPPLLIATYRELIKALCRYLTSPDQAMAYQKGPKPAVGTRLSGCHPSVPA